MKEQLITFKTAKLAKEKGFDWEVDNGYNNDSQLLCNDRQRDLEFNYNEEEGRTSAPTQSLLQKLLREKHKLSVEVEFDYAYEIDEGKGNYSDAIFTVKIADISNPRKYNVVSPNWQRRDGNQFTYEQALEKGLQAALELIKN